MDRSYQTPIALSILTCTTSSSYDNVVTGTPDEMSKVIIDWLNEAPKVLPDAVIALESRLRDFINAMPPPPSSSPSTQGQQQQRGKEEEDHHADLYLTLTLLEACIYNVTGFAVQLNLAFSQTLREIISHKDSSTMGKDKIVQILKDIDIAKYRPRRSVGGPQGGGGGERIGSHSSSLSSLEHLDLEQEQQDNVGKAEVKGIAIMSNSSGKSEKSEKSDDDCKEVNENENAQVKASLESIEDVMMMGYGKEGKASSQPTPTTLFHTINDDDDDGNKEESNGSNNEQEEASSSLQTSTGEGGGEGESKREREMDANGLVFERDLVPPINSGVNVTNTHEFRSLENDLIVLRDKALLVRDLISKPANANSEETISDIVSFLTAGKERFPPLLEAGAYGMLSESLLTECFEVNALLIATLHSIEGEGDGEGEGCVGGHYGEGEEREGGGGSYQR